MATHLVDCPACARLTDLDESVCLSCAGVPGSVDPLDPPEELAGR